MTLANQNANRAQAGTNRQQARNNPIWFTAVVGGIIVIGVGSVLAFTAKDWVHLLIAGIGLMMAGGWLKKAKLPAIASNVSTIGGPALQVVGALAIAWIFAGSGIAALTKQSVRAIDAGAGQMAEAIGKSVDPATAVEIPAPVIGACDGKFEAVRGCKKLTITEGHPHRFTPPSRQCYVWDNGEVDAPLVSMERVGSSSWFNLNSLSGEETVYFFPIPVGQSYTYIEERGWPPFTCQ